MKPQLLHLSFSFWVAAAAQPKTLHIEVDERVELLATVEMIAGAEVANLTGADLRYATEVKSAFAPFAHHPAVQRFDSMYFRYFNFEMPFQWVLHYALPDFRNTAPVTAAEFSPSRHYDQHRDTLALFLKELAAFYRESRFHRFYTAHRAFYDSLVRDVAGTVKGKNIIPVMEAYYGRSFASYHLVLSPLLLDGGFGLTVTNGSTASVHALIGPLYRSKGYPEFRKSPTLVLHELSHPFCNPVIDAAWPDLKGDTCLYRPVQTPMQAEGYWGWRSVLYESFNRAAEVVLTGKVYGETAAEKLRADYLAKQYRYLPLCLDVLDVYAAHRDTHPAIGEVAKLLTERFAAERARACP